MPRNFLFLGIGQMFPSPVEAAKVGFGGNHIVETRASTLKICIARSLVARGHIYFTEACAHKIIFYSFTILKKFPSTVEAAKVGFGRNHIVETATHFDRNVRRSAGESTRRIKS